MTTPWPTCDRHPDSHEPANTCVYCSSEAATAGKQAIAELYGRRMGMRCQRMFPPRYRDAQPTDPTVAAWVQQYAANRNCTSMRIEGPTGTGKTHQAYGALRAAASTPSRDAITWKATNAPDLYAELRPKAGVDQETVINSYRRTTLLLLDDIGAEKTSEWTEEVLYRLIDYRYNHCLPTIFTTNVVTSELRNKLGDRVASRLAEMCKTVVTLTGDDRRRTG